MAIIMSFPLTAQEIRVLQEYRRITRRARRAMERVFYEE